MNCIIIDDELTSRHILKKLISDTKNLHLIKEFDNGKDALDYLIINEIDLIFLDIHMPQINGFDLLDSLPLTPKVIITTSDREFAIKSFDYKCIVDYLQKPFNLSRFLRAVEKTNEPLIEEDQISIDSFPENNDLIIKINRRQVCLKIDSLSVIKRIGDDIQIISNDLIYNVKYSLNKVVQKLPSSMFLKINDYYLINLSKVKNIQNNNVLIDDHLIPVNKSNSEELKRRLNSL